MICEIVCPWWYYMRWCAPDGPHDMQSGVPLMILHEVMCLWWYVRQCAHDNTWGGVPLDGLWTWECNIVWQYCTPKQYCIGPTHFQHNIVHWTHTHSFCENNIALQHNIALATPISSNFQSILNFILGHVTMYWPIGWEITQWSYNKGKYYSNTQRTCVSGESINHSWDIHEVMSHECCINEPFMGRAWSHVSWMLH